MGKGRAPCCAKVGLNKGSWMPEEDMRLIAYINQYGHGNWRALPRLAGLARCGKSCRLRWINYLRPDIKRGNFSKEEEDTIIKLHGLLGNKWSKIASCLPGRTDNEIKNVWNTHLKKKIAAKDQNSNNWSELQKHEETPSSSSSATSAWASSSESESKTGKSFEESNKMDFNLSDMVQDFSSVLEQPSASSYDVGQKCEDSLIDIPEIMIEPSEIWNMISEDDTKANENQSEQNWNDENWMAYIERELESIREEELDIANIMKGEDPVASYFQGLHSSPFHMI